MLTRIKVYVDEEQAQNSMLKRQKMQKLLRELEL
jgi:hypothetical protein